MQASKETRKLLREVAAFACGSLAALAFCFACFIGIASDPANHTEQPTPEPLTVREKVSKPVPAGTYMPLYLQTDTQWAAVPYASDTIGDSGSGLACAAMAVKALTTQDVTPLTLSESVGSACLTDGVNDPEKLAQWMADTYDDYGIEVSPKVYATKRALAYVNDGWLCFAGLSGSFGDSDYSGHVILIWKPDESGYWVRDPASAGNSAHVFTASELNAVDFSYFVCVRGGNYGNAGH